MNRKVVSLVVALIASSAQANEVASGTVSPKGKPATTASLPACHEDGQTIQEIQDTQKANSKTKYKYDGFRKTFSSADDYELMARLTYAETLATNCPTKNTEVADVVVQVISNRVVKRKGDAKAVIFERDQFASSLNFYDDSKVRDFLCPKDKALWEHVSKAVRQASKSPSDATNYYLFQHFTKKKWDPPSWTKELKPAQSVKNDNGDCIVAYYNPTWK